MGTTGTSSWLSTWQFLWRCGGSRRSLRAVVVRRHDEEKLRLVRGAFSPGAKLAEFTRAEGVDASLLYRWRRQLLGAVTERPSFAPLVVTGGDGPVEAGGSAAPLPDPEPVPGIVEMELRRGARMRITGAADPAAIRAVMGALGRRRR